MHTVRFVDMPIKVKSFVERENDYCTIVINARLSREAQLERYKHETDHIKNDLDREETADRIEKETH